MPSTLDPELPASTDPGGTGIPHLKRLWAKTLGGQGSGLRDEHERDAALLDLLGLGLLPTYQFLYERRPTLEEFEAWVMGHFPDGVGRETMQACNNLLRPCDDGEAPCGEDVLSAADLAFWDEQGYVIVRNAVSADDCSAARKAIWEFLGMDEHDPATWYGAVEGRLQGIMVTLYRHAAIDRNRNSRRIQRAFEQVWKRRGLIVTADKCGFNPPETPTDKYRGTALHWDVSLARPVPFGTQGILYLTDTSADQGAFTLIPGFHRILDDWLQQLPPGANPRAVDLTTAHQAFGIAANAGDFIIWDQRVPHGGSPNRAALPRLVQYINWYAPLGGSAQEWV